MAKNENRDTTMTDPSTRIVRHIPLLRRYARALVGAQDRGDAYVRICLETLLEEPERLEPDGDLRLQLYALFHDIWTIVSADGSSPFDSGVDALNGNPLERGLAALPPVERQVLLLVSMEGFTFDEVSFILKIEESEVRDHLDHARGEIAAQVPARVLIIEDEPLIALDLARLLDEMGHEVCGSAARHEDAVAIASRERPQLVLADIQLRGGDNGIEAVQDILKVVDVPVIFVTGYPEKLLTGQRPEPTYVLSKPYEPEILKTAIGHALSIHPPQAV